MGPEATLTGLAWAMPAARAATAIFIMADMLFEWMTVSWVVRKLLVFFLAERVSV